MHFVYVARGVLAWFDVLCLLICFPPLSQFLPFGNSDMNMFNLGYLISFTTSVFMNKFDSSFNMLTSNISAVSSLWTGWMPSIRQNTVGFFPSIPLTVIAIFLSFVAVVPSYLYSMGLRELFASPRSKSVNSDYVPLLAAIR